MAKHRKYSKEFQLQTAKLVTEQGYSYEKTAKKLGTTAFLAELRHRLMPQKQRFFNFIPLVVSKFRIKPC